MCDLFVGNPATDGNCPSAASHQSGRLVTSTLPAAPGEIVTAWAVGLGAPSGGIPAGAPGPIAMNDITLNLSYQITVPVVFGTLGGSTGPSYLWAGLPTPNVGLYQINFAVPEPPLTLAACTANAGNLNLYVGRLDPLEFLLTPTPNFGSMCVAF